jgi:hypothetical protein
MPSALLTALSLAIAAGTVAAYTLLLGVPAVRNQPEGYVAAFAIAATVAGLALALARRWHAWLALGVSLLLLTGSAYMNFVMARIPAEPIVLHVGERPPDFTLPDAAGRRRGDRGVA